MDKPIVRFSYSSLNTFESCARRLEFDKFYPRLPKDHEAFAADVGTALHHGYQNYLVTQDETAAMWAMLESYPFLLEFKEEKDDRSMEAAISTLECMFESVDMANYEIAKIKKPDGTVVPAIEVPFEIRFKGLDIPACPKYPDGAQVAFTGYIDAIMLNLMSGKYRTLDIKTNRDFSKDQTGKYQYDSQQLPYGLIVEHVVGNPIESFEVLYLDTLVDLAEPQVTLYPFTKTEDDIQEWLLTRVLQFQMIQKYVQSDFFPRRSGGCMFYKRPCRYLTPCQNRDREMLFTWFMEGSELSEAAQDKPFEPWVVAEIEPFGEAA